MKEYDFIFLLLTIKSLLLFFLMNFIIKQKKKMIKINKNYIHEYIYLKDT